MVLQWLEVEVEELESSGYELLGATLSNRYELLDFVGRGGVGYVYRAFDRVQRAHVAVKVIAPERVEDPAVRRRFISDALLAASLSYPNLVQVHDVGMDGDLHYIPMEWLQGRTLRSLLDEQQRVGVRFSIQECMRVARDLLGGLAHLHRRLVHGNLKAENIWICEDGLVKIMDFGLGPVNPGMRGGASADCRSDQYSVATVVYELFCGCAPSAAGRALRKVREEVPACVSQAVMRALRDAPHERHGCVAEFLECLQEDEDSYTAARAEPAGRRALRAVAAALLVTVGLLGDAVRRPQEAPRVDAAADRSVDRTAGGAVTRARAAISRGGARAAMSPRRPDLSPAPGAR